MEVNVVYRKVEDHKCKFALDMHLSAEANSLVD